jgi:hypothetical protein
MINNNMEKGEKMKINLKKGDIFMYKGVDYFVIGKYIEDAGEYLISEVIYDSDTKPHLKFRVGQVVYLPKKDARVTKIKKDELPLYLAM